jgi:uncharacterized protein YndB with AHSA1/START domain
MRGGTVDDRIERELQVKAPMERVWEVITDPAYVSRWFGDTAEIDLRPGGPALFGWTEYGNTAHAVVERVEPPHEFAFRWARESGVAVDAGESTLVEFSLSAVDGGTLLRLVESGFTDEGHLKGNNEGWDAELSELVAFAESTG